MNFTENRVFDKKFKAKILTDKSVVFKKDTITTVEYFDIHRNSHLWKNVDHPYLVHYEREIELLEEITSLVA